MPNFYLMDDLRSVLVFRLGGIGDVVTATPVLRTLRQNYPDTRIDFMAEQGPSKLVRESSWVDRVISDTELYRCQDIFQFLTPRFGGKLYDLYTDINRHEYDLFIELHRLNRWSLVPKPFLSALASGAPVRAGLRNGMKGFFLSHGIEDRPSKVKHQVFWFRDILKNLGIPVQRSRPSLELDDERFRKADRILDDTFEDNTSPVVGLFLGANPIFPEKRWPITSFVDLSRRITHEFDCSVLAFSGPREEELVDAFRTRTNSNQRIRSLKRNYDIRTVAALIHRLNGFVSADTGPMHIGVAMETPTVGIFGSGEWHWYGSYPERWSFRAVLPPGAREANSKIPDVPDGQTHENSVAEVFNAFSETVTFGQTFH
ncbi:MAG: glycosyltransferase family 9 protein [bacterium]